MQRLFLLLIAMFVVALPAMADQRSETVRELERAKKEVVELENALDKLKVQQNTAQKQLRQAETEIANLGKKIAELKKELADTEAKLAWLAEEKQKAEEKRQEQEKVFATQAKATYESGRQEYIKLLLNQQDPDKLSRTLVYYDYVSQARLVQLSEFKETLKQLQEIETDMARYQQELTAQNTALQEQHQQLAAARKKRLQALASIKQQIAVKNDRISERERDQIELSRVLRTIDATLARQAREREAQSAASTTTATPKNETKGQIVSDQQQVGSGTFAQLKGKLAWPVSGKVIASYGSVRGDDSRSKWDGVVIGANRGSAVKAIYNGRVVYSDWLRGVGWLIIVDHGQGYYSLYGHNQSLLKRVGDTVKAGDTLASVGNSGGTESTGLYFSIRQRGQTVNPALWCQATN